MKKRLFCLFFSLIIICVFVLNGCGIVFGFSALKELKKYQSMQAEGYYLGAGHYANTKWECQEINMTIYFGTDSGNGHVSTRFGVYKINNVSYRILPRLEFNCAILKLHVIKTTSIQTSHQNSNFVAGIDQQIGDPIFVTEHIIKDGVLYCTVLNTDYVGNDFPSSLTFVQTNRIGNIAKDRWYAKELDMYMDSFEDVEITGEIDIYFKGEININGQLKPVEIYEYGNNNCYSFYFYEGLDQNNSIAVSMHFNYDSTNETITATLYDEVLNPIYGHPEWLSQTPTITFTKEIPQ